MRFLVLLLLTVTFAPRPATAGRFDEIVEVWRGKVKVVKEYAGSCCEAEHQLIDGDLRELEAAVAAAEAAPVAERGAAWQRVTMLDSRLEVSSKLLRLKADKDAREGRTTTIAVVASAVVVLAIAALWWRHRRRARR